MIEIVSVDRADIIEAELFEHRAAGHHAARIFLRAQGAFLEKLRQPMGELLSDLAQTSVGLARKQTREISGHRANRRSDRHIIVVEDHDQARVHRAGIVHRLIGHAGRHRAISDHRDDIATFVLQVARDRHAKPGRDRGGRMRGAERIVLALGALGEPGQAAALAERADTIAPAGDDLVRIGLVSDVPDQPVVAAC